MAEIVCLPFGWPLALACELLWKFTKFIFFLSIVSGSTAAARVRHPVTDLHEQKAGQIERGYRRSEISGKIFFFSQIDQVY